MRLTIHDVGHGQCISLVHENGNVMLWDCGHTNDNRPSEFLPALGVTGIEHFFVTNYDEDHISDLPELRNNLGIDTLTRNSTISVEQLRSLKLEGGPISPAMESMLDMHGRYNGPVSEPGPGFPGVLRSHYHITYSDDFDDTNNISLVTFLTCGERKIVIPGDIEKKGWLELLRRDGFVRELSTVDIFIASHHGRESGYCAEVFEVCQPLVVVVSDSNIQHATQQMVDVYGRHASGCSYNGQNRKVLTTRSDGSIALDF